MYSPGLFFPIALLWRRSSSNFFLKFLASIKVLIIAFSPPPRDPKPQSPANVRISGKVTQVLCLHWLIWGIRIFLRVPALAACNRNMIYLCTFVFVVFFLPFLLIDFCRLLCIGCRICCIMSKRYGIITPSHFHLAFSFHCNGYRPGSCFVT